MNCCFTMYKSKRLENIRKYINTATECLSPIFFGNQETSVIEETEIQETSVIQETEIPEKTVTQETVTEIPEKTVTQETEILEDEYDIIT